MKSLLCLLGFHDWHEHEVYSLKVCIPDTNPLRYWRDRICLKCGHEDRKASRARRDDSIRSALKASAERDLREKGTNRL